MYNISPIEVTISTLIYDESQNPKTATEKMDTDLESNEKLQQQNQNFYEVLVTHQKWVEKFQQNKKQGGTTWDPSEISNLLPEFMNTMQYIMNVFKKQ